jgi:riboflavin kinase/FMN adenylyltransferase
MRVPRLGTITGPVVHGDKRGRTLGFPTANVEIKGRRDLEFGVYAGWADGRPAAISIGVRPTFGVGLQPLAEAYLLDFDGDLYGRTIRIELVARLRGEVAFEDVDALLEQIREDVDAVRSMLS